MKQKDNPRVKCIQPEHKDDYEDLTVYHYTSPEAFRAIIQKKTLRFTDIRFLNDKSESTYFVQVLSDFLEENEGGYPRLENCFRRMLRGRDPSEISNIYDENFMYETPRSDILNQQPRCFVFSTCTEYDCLNMWNYYVYNHAYQGYNIGFEAGKLLDTFDGEDIEELSFMQEGMVRYGRVVYDGAEQFKLLEAMAEGVENKLDWLAPYDHNTEESMVWKQWIVQREIDAYAAFFKHPAFKAENEFRIAVVMNAQDVPMIPKHDRNSEEYRKEIVEAFTTKRGLMVPYLQIPLPADSIKGVTVAPIMEFELARRGVSELMAASGVEEVDIMQSAVPIRF